MSKMFGPIAALVWKDVLLEARTKDIVVAVLVFSLLTMVIFNFAIDPTPATVGLVAPGVLWVAFVFGGVLGLNRSFALEKDNNSLMALLMTPVSRDSIYFGKMIANLLFMLLVEAMAFPVFAVLFNFPLFVWELFPVAFLSTLGIVSVGTVFSAMAVNTRAREVMLPLLFFPVVLPAIIAAVEISGMVLRGEPFSEILPWLPILAAFDAVFLVVSPIAFHLVVED